MGIHNLEKGDGHGQEEKQSETDDDDVRDQDHNSWVYRKCTV